MFGKRINKSRQAWTLVEMLIAAGIFSLVGLAVCSLFLFGARSFAALSNYAVLDKANRQAIDKLTLEIRRAKLISNYTTNPPTLSLINADGLTVIYTFNPRSQEMIRDASDGSHRVMLTNCSLLSFDLRKRCPSNGVYDFFPTANNDWSNTAKVVQLSWKTSITLSPTANVNSENVQTARVVVRNARTHD